MSSFFEPLTCYGFGCMRLRFLWASFECAHICYIVRLTIGFHQRIGFARFVICMRLRLSTSFFGALRTMRYKDGSIASSGSLKILSPSSFGTWISRRHYLYDLPHSSLPSTGRYSNDHILFLCAFDG
jgi:hypothetical protein